MATKHLLIKGKVQGVFYRDTAKATAEKLGVTGWVRNTPDGHVEALITGTEDQLAGFIEWARRGPRAAKVIDIIHTHRNEETFDGFIVRE